MRSGGTPTTSRQMRLGLVVGLVDRDPEPVGIEPEHVGVELPRERDRLGLEVVAEAEVAEHLEEREVAVRAADVVEVVVLAAGPHALLHRRRPAVRRRLLADEVRLERHHAGDREQHGLVVRDHARGRDDGVAARREEVEKGRAKLVGGPGRHPERLPPVGGVPTGRCRSRGRCEPGDGRLPCRSGAASTSRSASSRRAISSRPSSSAAAHRSRSRAATLSGARLGNACCALRVATTPIPNPADSQNARLNIRRLPVGTPSRRVTPCAPHARRTPAPNAAARTSRPVTGSNGMRGRFLRHPGRACGEAGFPSGGARFVARLLERGAHLVVQLTVERAEPALDVGEPGSGPDERDARHQRGEHGDRQRRRREPRGHRRLAVIRLALAWSCALAGRAGADVGAVPARPVELPPGDLVGTVLLGDPARRLRREDRRSPRRGRASRRQGSERRGGARGPSRPVRSRTSARAAPSAVVTVFDFGREREVQHRVREVELRLGQPDELDGPRRGVGDEERLRVGEPDVLRREDHEPARDEARVLAGLEHPREPVEPGVGIGAADALDERRHDVVVLVVAVAERAQRRARPRRRRA